MSDKPSTSKERIIPIQLEDDSNSCFLDDCMDFKEQESPPRQSDAQLVPDNFVTADISNLPEEASPKHMLPIWNVKEKIILVVDIAEDENFTPFKLDNSQQNKPLDMLKRAIEMFLHSKQIINKKHEYALVILNENSANWLVNFTNNTSDIVKALGNIGACEAEDIFDLNSLFDVILQNVQVPEFNEISGTTMPPPFVVRTILFYGRSYTMPKLSRSEEVEQLIMSPYFTFDVLMTHEPVDDDNNCNKIFSVLQNVDQKGFAHFFPVAREAKTLFESIAKLLGHPLQRPVQKCASYLI